LRQGGGNRISRESGFPNRNLGTRAEEPIRKANLTLDKLRILLRIAHNLTFLPHKQYEYASRQIDEVGRMLGAWGKAGEKAEV